MRIAKDKRLCLVLPLLCILGVSCGCVHSDFTGHFTIKGKVFDKTTNRPIARVKVAFTDSARFRRDKTFSIVGETDDYGRIQLEFSYFWGVDRVYIPFYGFPTTGTEFIVELSEGHYLDRQLRLKESSLPKTQKGYYKLWIDLREVGLEPRQAVPGGL